MINRSKTVKREEGREVEGKREKRGEKSKGEKRENSAPKNQKSCNFCFLLDKICTKKTCKICVILHFLLD